MSSARDRQATRATYYGTPGPKTSRTSIEHFLCCAYQLLPSDVTQQRRQEYRENKTWFTDWMKRKGQPISSIPTLNKILSNGAIPWPMPPEDHLVLVIDGSTLQLRWVSKLVVDVLGCTTEEDLVGRKVCDAFGGATPLVRDRFIAVQARAHERIAHPNRKRIQLDKGQVDQEVFDTRIGRALLHLRTSYGTVYGTWFVDGTILEIEPLPAQTELFNVHEKRVAKFPLHQLELYRQELARHDSRPVDVQTIRDLMEKMLPPYRFPTTDMD